jgi:hypothetical protein
VVGGTPTTSGVFSGTLLVTDSVGSSIGTTFSQAISPAVCGNWPVRAGAGTPDFYPDFPSAYQTSANSDLIQLQALNFSSDFLLDRDIGVTLTGGYDCGYTGNTVGFTTIHGILDVSRGTVDLSWINFQ